jgi:tRNA-dihydrouridine synthase B
VDVVAAAAEIAEQAGPDFLDLNLGCPVKNVALKGAGAGLLREPETMEAMIREVVRRVRLPLTVKTRLGWDDASIRIVENVRMFEACGVRAVTIHARTRCQMYRGEADWGWIARARDAVSIPVAGNGDALSAELAARMFEVTGCDAVMLGRGAIADPWVFANAKHLRATGLPLPTPTFAERAAACLAHLRFSIEHKGDERRALIEFRKFWKGYLRGAPGAAELRAGLVETVTLADAEERLAEFLAAAAEADAVPA